MTKVYNCMGMWRMMWCKRNWWICFGHVHYGMRNSKLHNTGLPLTLPAEISTEYVHEAWMIIKVPSLQGVLIIRILFSGNVLTSIVDLLGGNSHNFVRRWKRPRCSNPSPPPSPFPPPSELATLGQRCWEVILHKECSTKWCSTKCKIRRECTYVVKLKLKNMWLYIPWQNSYIHSTTNITMYYTYMNNHVHI